MSLNGYVYIDYKNPKTFSKTMPIECIKKILYKSFIHLYLRVFHYVQLSISLLLNTKCFIDEGLRQFQQLINTVKVLYINY